MANYTMNKTHQNCDWTVSADRHLLVRQDNQEVDMGVVTSITMDAKAHPRTTYVKHFKIATDGNLARRIVLKPKRLVCADGSWESEVLPELQVWLSRNKRPRKIDLAETFRSGLSIFN